MEAVAYGEGSVGTQTYNSLQALYEHRFDRNLEAQLAYTLSKCMTNNIGFYGNAEGQSQPQGYYWQDIYNPQAEWGPCYYNTPQIFTGYAVYSLPVGHGQAFGSRLNKVANAAFGNWQYSIMTIDHKGYSLTAIDWRNWFDAWGNFVDVTPRASCDGPVQYVRQFNSRVGGERFWSSSDFTTTPHGALGNCSNGTIRGPGEMDFDMSLQKTFALMRHTNMQFRAEAVNAFNHPLFQMPDVALSDGNEFGVAAGATAAENERQVQFGLKLLF